MATIFDRISRALLKSHPEMLGWLLGTGAFTLVGWLDAHLGSPEAAERIADALAFVRNEKDGGRPWAVLVEFQTQPDADMLGRVMEYLGAALRREKPAELPGDRFAVAAVVVNLTGRGNSFPVVTWPEAGLTSGALGRDVNLSQLEGADLLERVARGEAPAVLLAWIPLMKGGGEAGIIQRWLKVAGGVKDVRLRANLGYARIYAELTKCRPAWQDALEGWEMTESVFLNELLEKAMAKAAEKALAKGRDEGARQGQAELLLGVLEDRFGPLPADLAAALRGEMDLAVYRRWTVLAATSESLDAFRRAVGK